jgi:DNA primase
MKDIFIDIVVVCRRLGLDLKKAGSRYVCSCPLHVDANPSFTVYPDTNSFYCFSCHVGGTPLHLAKVIDPNIDSWAALVSWYNATEPTLVRLPRKYPPSLQKIKELLTDNPVTLPESEPSKDPFLSMFGIRYVKRGQLVGRHIIPIYFDGELIAYEARCFTGQLSPKTLILPSDVKIHSFLWNYDNVLPSHPIILVEGIKDALAVMSFGYYNVVSSFGAQLSREQALLLLSKQPTEVIITYDADGAGDKGAEDAISYLLSWVHVSRVYLPRGTDPWDINTITWQRCFSSRKTIDNKSFRQAFLEKFRREVLEE